MFNRNALIFLLAAATVQDANAFAPAPTSSSPLRSTMLFESSVEQQTPEQVAEAYQQIIDTTQETEKLIMDIPPAPVAAKKSVPKKKKGNPHKEGVFSPIVVAAGSILGEEQLNKIRAKSISLHSDIIKSFVDTSDSAFGKAVLTQLFNLVDTDNSGYLDKEEVAVALNLLGFKWLKEKHVGKIFERADANGDEEISLEEFINETPKTLRVNLVKLAKTNGGDMGLLV
ncbi:hypothetical protein ACHAXR_009975 [Thalassiosira sp. AJA248-18]